MVLMIILAIAAPLCLVVVILGCLNCFMKRKPGFSPFANPNFVEEGTAGRHNDAFAVDMEPTPTGDESHVVVEPLPEITSKSVSLPPLRPKVICVEKDNEDSALSFIGSYRPFKREHLTYLNPLGTGWFGQTINSEALRITSDSMKNQVVVKILKDDASKLEENQFIEEIMPYRRVEHRHVISLLGQCMETKPYLVILEYASHGNLKNFLESHKQSLDALMKKNRLLQFCQDTAAGMACIHRHNFVHCDLAARNCLVMSDFTVKVGDYGLAEHLYKEDYFQTGKELLPIRWMAPECLVVEEGNVCSSQKYSKASDMWSFGVFLWEVFSMAERPYDMLTDEAVLQGVVIDKVVALAEIPHRFPFHDRLSLLMNECFKDPSERITIESAYQFLDHMSKEKVETVNDDLDFDQKWNHLIPNTQSRSQSLISEDGSATALAGSFSSEVPLNLDDKGSSVDLVDGKNGSRENIQPAIDNQNVQPNLPKVPSVSSDQVFFEDEITSLPRAATPSKSNTENSSSPPQMSTSTPVPNKSIQNKISSSFLTAPTTPSSQYMTAQEGLSGDGSLLDHTSQELNSLSTEGNVTILGSETDQFDAFNDFSDKNEFDKNTELFSTVQKPDEIVSEPQTKENMSSFDMFNNGSDIMTEETSTKEKNAFDFGDFVSGNDQNGNAGLSDPTKPQQMDSSFVVLVPSMLSQDENMVTTGEPQNVSSPSVPSQLFSNNDDLETADTNAPSETSPSTAEADISFGSFEESSVTPNELLTAEKEMNVTVEPPKDVISDNLGLGNNMSSSSNPFSPSNPFTFGDTTSTSSQDAILVNKSEVDASSSLNSSLVGWDTSFPDGNASLNFGSDQLNGFGPMVQSADSISFGENAESDKQGDVSSLVSSDFSFVEVPAASENHTDAIQTELLTPGTTNNDFLSGFDATPSHVEPVPSFSPSQNDDPFGLSSTPQQLSSSSSEVMMAPEVATDTTTKDSGLQAPNPDPFADFMFDSNSSVPSASETPKSTMDDIFSTGLNQVEKTDDGKKSEPSFDLLGLDPFSNTTTSSSTSNATGSMLGEDLVAVSSVDNQVGTVYKCDDSSSDQSDDESGVNSQSLTESLTIPTVASDSCYASVTDSKITEAMSEENSEVQLTRSSISESDSTRDCVDSVEDEDVKNKVCDRVMGNELFLDLEENSDGKSSPDDSDSNDSSDDTSSTSGSEREYICVNPFDTGQPPTSNLDSDKENLDPDSPTKDLAFEDLNEQDLKIVSEIYLSKGVKSPRVFEVPTLETIPEHQPLYCISEEAAPTPSETSSIGPRDDDLFGSDSYEWDDFYGDSLIGKDDVGPDVDISQSSMGDHNISNWSLDFDAESTHSNASSIVSTTLLNGSDSACMGNDNKPSISDQNVQCLSDSEILMSKSSKVSPRPSLVASILAKQQNNSNRFSSPTKSSRDKSSFYSLMEDFDFQLDSSQEDSTSPVSVGLHDDDGKDDIVDDLDKKSQPPNSPVSSSSFFPSSFSSLPSSLHSSLHLLLSKERSREGLDIDQDGRKQTSSPTDTSGVASSSMDLLGMGFDAMPQSNSPTTTGQSSDSADSSQDSSKAATAADVSDFSLI